MRGNIVVAAAIAGGAFIIASVIFVIGINRGLNQAAARMSQSIDKHTAEVAQLREVHAQHAAAVRAAGAMVGSPTVTMKSPVPIVDQQPLRIQGTVGVEMGENKESKKR
jgi:hypothetical protein